LWGTFGPHNVKHEHTHTLRNPLYAYDSLKIKDCIMSKKRRSEDLLIGVFT